MREICSSGSVGAPRSNPGRYPDPFSACEILKCLYDVDMEASVVDLRYRMKDVLQALDRNEEVTVLHRGKVKGTIVPEGRKGTVSAKDHPLFGSAKEPADSLEEEMAELRGGRFRDL